MSYIYHTPNIFKHYSGKGLTKKGSCTLDENGILSNVNRGGDGCYVTSFKMTNLSKPFTLSS